MRLPETHDDKMAKIAKRRGRLKAQAAKCKLISPTRAKKKRKKKNEKIRRGTEKKQRKQRE